MKDLVAAALLTSAIIIIIGGVGRVLMALLRIEPSLRAHGAPLGLSIIIVLAWPLQYAGVPTRIIAASVVVGLVALMIAVVVHAPVRDRLSPHLRFGICEAWFALVAIAATVVFFAPALREYGLTLASLGNVDPVSYSLDARQALASGYINAGGVANRDLAHSASWNWPGAVTTQALFAGLTGRPAGVASMLTLIALTTIGQMQTSAIIARLARTDPTDGVVRKVALLTIPFVSAIAWLNPFGGYIIANGFVAQLTLMALIPATLVFALSLARPGNPKLPLAFALAIILGADLTTYGAVAPTVIAITAAVASGAYLARTAGNLRWPAFQSRDMVPAVTIACASLGGLLWFSYNGVQITTSSTAGWQIELPRASTIVGLTELFSSSWQQQSYSSVDLAVCAIVVALLAANVLMLGDQQRWTRLLMGTAFLAVAIAGIAAFGPTAYKTWKLLGTCAPFVVAAAGASLIALVLRVDRRSSAVPCGLAVLALTVGLALSGTSIAAREWTTSPWRFGATPDQVALLNDPVLRNAGGVNILGAGLPETMMMLLFVPTPNRVAISESFYPPLSPSYPITVATRSIVPAPEDSMPLNATYVVVRDTPSRAPRRTP